MQDAAACLLRNGEVFSAVEEERLTRVKHTGAFPGAAIRWCLDEAGITSRDLAHVAFNMRPWTALRQRGIQMLESFPRSLGMLDSRGNNWLKMVGVGQHFRHEIGKGPYQWHWVDHHLSHAASAFYPSEFENAAVIVADGSGELASTSTYRAGQRGLELVDSTAFPHSLGYFYSALTQWLGFKPAVAEGKTMGLSSYGTIDSNLMMHFRDMISDDGHIEHSWFEYQYGSARYYSPRWLEAFGPSRVPESEFSDWYYAVAFAGQRRLEEVLFNLLNKLHDRVQSPNLCLAGGVALNSVANGKIVDNTPFEHVFVQPVAHDAGTAWGAGLSVHCTHAGGQRPRPQTTVAWGPRFERDRIDAAIHAAGLVVQEDVEPAQLLAQGQVIGWFSGRSEMGPRALGFRSILADPRDPNMADRVNLKVKRREAFRPFAPAVLDTAVEQWFEGITTPFMTTVATVHPECRDRVPAITHVDGTARVQVVSETTNREFYALIERFAELTDVPMVLNTSFNVRGEPIVCTPEEAIRDFMTTDMDALVLEGQVLVRP